MNANELADELENNPLAYGNDIQEWLGEAATMLRQQQAEIECLKEVNAKQVDYITQQKYAYGKLWKEHMELFWKHEQDTDLTNE